MLSFQLQTLQGYGAALSALCHLISELPCGVPARLLDDLMSSALEMVEEAISIDEEITRNDILFELFYLLYYPLLQSKLS